MDAPIGMAMVATDERILEANDTLRRMLGYSLEELRALTVIDITHPHDLQVEAAPKAAAYHQHDGSSSSLAVRGSTNRIGGRFRRAGHEAPLAHDRADDLHRAAAAGPIDRLITDITMPDIHGPRLADMLHQSQPGLFVVLISGHARGAVPTGGDGAHAVLRPKPFRPAELAKEAIPLTRSQDEPIDDRI